MEHLVAVLFGLWWGVRPTNQCGGPGNPMAYPSTPVPVQQTTCTRYQAYESSSQTTNYHPSCGYTVAFGPLGDLKYPADSYYIQADWGYTVTNQADCESSYTWGTAWGYRCLSFHCTEGDWERIDVERMRRGVWNAASGECRLAVELNGGPANYNTVRGQSLAFRFSGGERTQEQAKVRIVVSRNTGGCLTATPVPPPPPVVRTPAPTPTPRPLSPTRENRP